MVTSGYLELACNWDGNVLGLVSQIGTDQWEIAKAECRDFQQSLVGLVNELYLSA